MNFLEIGMNLELTGYGIFKKNRRIICQNRNEITLIYILTDFVTIIIRGVVTMKSVYESIMTGLNEAIEDAQSEGKKLNRRTVTIIPVKEYGAEQVRNIRNSVGMSQSTFAGYLGVTKKTVEAWEAGTNHPSGAASRILNMMEMDTELVEKYPFVQCGI